MGYLTEPEMDWLCRSCRWLSQTCDKNSLEDLLKISAKHGVVIEHLAQNRPGDAIEWMPQEKDEDGMAYFTPVTSEAHDNGFMYHRQGNISRKARCQPL